MRGYGSHAYATSTQRFFTRARKLSGGRQHVKQPIVNREEGLEAGAVSDNMLKFWSRDNTSASESRLVIRAVQKIKLCLAKRLVLGHSI